jgi:aminopeptidase-like protein
MYYDYLFIQDDRNETDIQFLNDKLENSEIQSYLRHKELERTTNNLMEMIEKFEDKLNYFELTLKRENDLRKRDIFDLKDRVHTLEDQINTLIGKINNSVLVL